MLSMFTTASAPRADAAILLLTPAAACATLAATGGSLIGFRRSSRRTPSPE
jgi:hypothetical protein